MTQGAFLSIVKSWIDDSQFYGPLSELIKGGLTTKTNESTKDSSIEVIRKVTGEDEWVAVKHTNKYLEQEWETFVIFHGVEEKEVVIHISCFGDISHTTSFPYQRLEIIRTFARATESVSFDEIYRGAEFKYAEEGDKQFLIDVVNGDVTPSLPVIYVTKFFGSAGYAVDLNTLAKRLEGIACVVCEPDDAYTHSLNNKVKDARHQLPKNGAVGVYYGGNKVIYPNNRFSSIDGYVMQYVLQVVTSHTNKNYTTPAKFNRDMLAEHEALLDEYSVENMTLEEKLKEAEEKIASLTVKNQILTETNESLRAALSSSGVQQLIQKSELEEFFDDEQHDAVISALEVALRSIGEDTRLYEIIKSLLEANKYTGHGTVIFSEFKKLFANGANLNKSEMARLEDLGFSVVGDNTHKKLVFKNNEKYLFPLASTGSDNKRGGLNFAGDVLHKLSIY